jgi:extradiol dioxygenase family protein
MDRLHHVAIQVWDLAEAVEWYRSHFGCTVAYSDDSWALLDFENVQLALVTPGQLPPHISFATPRAADFGNLTRHRDGSASVYVTDPAGNAIEVLDSRTLGPSKAA